MVKSRRHHYIPQFLTKYFSDENESIFVYNKMDDNYFIGNPINLFVEKHRNTFLNSDGVEDDMIEKMYAYYDTLFSQVLKVITTSNNITSENYKLILFLAYITKWRVPQYDESFKNAKEYFSIDDLGLGIKDENDQRIDVNLEDFFELEMQQEMKRFLLAIQPFRFKEDFKKLIKNSFIVCTPFPAFICDCPFNEASIMSDEIFEDFVFPITKDLTLVYSNRINRNEIQYFIKNGDEKNVSIFLREFSAARDISTLHLADRLIGCCDRDYLKYITETYKKFKSENKDTPYNITIFNLLYRFKEYACT